VVDGEARVDADLRKRKTSSSSQRQNTARGRLKPAYCDASSNVAKELAVDGDDDWAAITENTHAEANEPRRRQIAEQKFQSDLVFAVVGQFVMAPPGLLVQPAAVVTEATSGGVG
jgi:hypothetical protein